MPRSGRTRPTREPKSASAPNRPGRRTTGSSSAHKGRGGDPFVWGVAVWAMLYEAAAAALHDRTPSGCAAAYAVATALTQCILCNPCRLFYIQRFETERLDEPPAAGSSSATCAAWARGMRRWVRSLHSAVSFKVSATRPCPRHAPPLQPERSQLDRRDSFFGGSSVGPGAMLQVLDAMARYHRFRSEKRFRASFALLLVSLAKLWRRSGRFDRRALGVALRASVETVPDGPEARSLARLPARAAAALFRSSSAVVEREWSGRHRHLFAPSH